MEGGWGTASQIANFGTI